MDFVVFVVLLILFFFIRFTSKRNNYRGISLCKLFIGFWAVIFFFRSFYFYGLYDLSLNVYLIVVIGCLFFVMGYSMAWGALYNHHNNQRPKVAKESISFRILYYIVLIGAIYIVIKQILLLLPMIIASGMAEARGDMSEENSTVLEGPWIILYCYFASPFIKATLMVMVVKMFGHNKIKVIEIFQLVVLMMLSFLSHGGRLLIMDVFFAICYMFVVNRKHMSVKNRRNIILGVLILVSLGAYYTIERGSDFFRSIYEYYCGGITYLDQTMQNQPQLFEPYLYGMNFYQGFFKPFFGFFELMGMEKPDALIQANDFILSSQHTVSAISAKSSINYYMGVFGYAYRDGGLLAVAFDLFIYGIICCVIDKRESTYYYAHRWLAIKIVFVYSALFTMAQSPFSAYLPVMTLFYVYIITSRFFAKKVIVKNSFI